MIESYIVLIIKGVLAGFAIAAPVGAVGVLCIRRTLAVGWLSGFATGLGAALADSFYGAIAAFGLSAVAGLMEDYRDFLQLGGGIFLLYMGYRTFTRPAEPEQANDIVAPLSTKHLVKDFFSALALTITNPATIIAFFAVFASIGIKELADGEWIASVILVGSVFAGALLWWLLLCEIIHLIRHKLGSRTIIWVNWISGSIIMLFGILAIIDMLIFPISSH